MINFDDNGTTLIGQWFEPEGFDNYPVVLLATGDGPSGSKGLTWVNLVPRFLELNFGCFLFDFDGLGHSPNRRRDLTMTKGVSNIHAAIREIEKNSKADSTRIAGVGASFGGNALLLAAPDEPSITVLALKSPCCFIAEAFACEIGLDKVEKWSVEGYSEEAGFNYDAFLDSYNHNTYAAAKRIKAPVRVVHGSKDSAVPIRQSMDLMKFLENGSLTVIEGADHWYSEGNEWEMMATDIIAFVKENL